MGALEKIPGVQNWVDRLPAGLKARWHRSIIYRAAVHMHRERGMRVGHAIASAKNWCEHIARTGDVKQWPGPQQVNPASVAECVEALAVWAAMRASARANSARKLSAPTAPVLRLAFDPLRDPEGTTTGGQFTADPAKAKKVEAEENLRRVQEMRPSDRSAFLESLTPEQLRALFFSMGQMPPPGAPPWLRGVVGGEMARRGLIQSKAAPGDYESRAKAKKATGKKPGSGSRSSGASKPSSSSGGSSGSSGGGSKPSSGSSGGGSKSTGKPKAKPQPPPKPPVSKPPATPKPPPKPKDPTAAQLAAWQRLMRGHLRHPRSTGHRRNMSAAPGSPIELAGPSPAARQRMARSGIALPDGSYPIPDRAHLRKAVMAFGRAPEAKRGRVKAHIRKRASQLGALGTLPDNWR